VFTKLSQKLVFSINGHVEELDEELAKYVSYDAYYNGVDPAPVEEVLTATSPPKIQESVNPAKKAPSVNNSPSSTANIMIDIEPATAEEEVLVSKMRLALCGMVNNP
jgi:hypothetical protein